MGRVAAIMTALEIVQALGGHWYGNYGMVRCPAHPDQTPSLKIADGDKAVLLYCYTGCDQNHIIDALRVLGLWAGRGDRSIPWASPELRDDDREARTAKALKIWRKAVSGSGTPVQKYLRWRGYCGDVPPSLRYHDSTPYNHAGLFLPCMVAAVQAPDRRITAVHRTWIRGDGHGKAGVNLPKKALGPLGAGAVRLGPAGPVLGLAEGIETGLSAMQMFGLPVWCALGSRLASVGLPPAVREVQIFGDNGDPGHRAAEKAAETFTAQGRRVFLRFPPKRFGDFNDELLAGVAACPI